MIRYKSILIMIFVLISVTVVAARHFPDALVFPRGTEIDDDYYDGDADSAAVVTAADVASEADGSTASFFAATDQNYSDGLFTSSNSVYYMPDLGVVDLEQSLLHEMRRDRFGSTRQYLNASGELSYPLSNYRWITPGLDWTPVAQHSDDRGVYNALATLDMGPNARIDAMGIPVLMRVGVSGRRVDSLAAYARVGEYRSDVGAYGGFRVGSEDEQLPFAPIYFYADGLGRRIESSGMASLSSNALGALQVGEGDSLFVYGAASLFNGREGYLEESADSRAAFFAETPWRIERDVAFTAGYKVARWSALEPSIYYSVDHNHLEFPNDTRLRDETTLRQTVSGALATDTSAGIYYNGVVRFTWREHDKLFRRDNMSLTQASGGAGNRDSLNVNLWDYSAFDPHTEHRFTVKLPRSLRAIYDLNVSRYLTEYPNRYVDESGDTVRNADDNDRRLLTHRLALVYAKDTALRVELFGELSEYDLVYMRSAKSGGTRKDLGQKIGLLVDWSPSDALTFSEAITAEAKRGEFEFPEYHQDALERPRFSRAVGSSFVADWQTTERVGLKCKWDIKYSDFGFWYGEKYMQDVLARDPNARVDYYAIAAKSVYTTIDLAARLTVGPVEFTPGNAFMVARDRNYSGGYYIISNENGYTAKPYINAAVVVGDMAEISARASRTFVIGNRDLSYWDMRLQAMASF